MSHNSLDFAARRSNHAFVDLAAAPSYHASSLLEKVLEHRLLAALTTELWCRGVRDFEVLRGEVDAQGHDLVFEVAGLVRHAQLKAMVRGGKRRDVGVSLALARKPAGCVIWMIYDPDTLELGPFLWFGGEPGEPLPPPGDRVVRHSKGNAAGEKMERAGHRLVSRSRFATLETVCELVDALFGTPGARRVEPDQLALLREQLERSEPVQAPAWVARVREGDFGALPADLSFETSVELAHLIDGYGLVPQAGWGDPFAFADERLERASCQGWWAGGPAELWACLFLEHRRWRMANRDPDPEQEEVLDRLCRQLRASLV
jgi:hypothetical protein